MNERTQIGARPGSPLSMRQQEVLVLVRQGKTNKQIARDLGIALGTVKIHVRCLLIKMGVATRLQAALK